MPDFSPWLGAMAETETRLAEHRLLTGRVLRADGKTPAYGATIQYFSPHNIEPEIYAVADADGSIDAKNALDQRGATLIAEPPGSPIWPVIVAMLPGECGATILDASGGIDKPLTIELPPAVTLRGHLTIGQAKLAGQPRDYHIFAAYQGKGMLDSILSVWATPQPDGSFELAGLTPGTYKVQASLDNIWLSDTITLVASDKPMADIHLDIPAPGGPAAVHVTSAKGKPLVGVQVVVDRPAGPLTDLDWPASFTSDGAGEVWIPALEAGKHTVRFKDNSGVADFVVPPLPADAPVVVHLTEH
jgi:hypothetical protein